MTGPLLDSPHLNPNVLGLPPSATLAINERSDALIAEGRKVFKLGLGQSPFPVPGPVQPGRVIARFGQSLALNGWSRASPRGVAYNAGGHSPSPVRTLPIR